MKHNRQGSILIELVVAMGVLAAALLPLALSYVSDQRLCHSAYRHAIAMELVDGEMEALAAGEWRALGDGTHDYVVHAGAMSNLPVSKFTLTVLGRQLRLEWRPENPRLGAPVVREATGK